MANVLDLRRRIRSVKNTRQITKAMKMVSAAKLRRAQERAMRARPYAQMLANVLESLVRRTDLCNEQTGEIMHPLLVEREEKNVLVDRDRGRQGICRRASTRTSARRRSGSSTSAAALGQNIDLEPIGKKAIALLQEEVSRGRLREDGRALRQRSVDALRDDAASRAARSRLPPSIRTCCCGWSSKRCREMAHSIIERYERAEIDSVYLVYNEFKSVISQRVVVEKLLPIRKLGSHEITAAEEMTEEQKEAAARAASTAGVSHRGARGDGDRSGRRRSSAPRTWTTSSTRRRSGCFAT